MKLIVIGSANNSHIVLNSPYVSSYHAEILLLDNGDILLEDKGSRNGTFYNNTKLTPNQEVSIKRGDNIRFANMPLDWSLVPTLQKVDFKTIKEMRGIGSNYRNKYQIQGSKVSRFHATMKKMANGKWYIQDHSTNGTTVNGSLIPKDQDLLIKRGDRIMCAGVAVPNPCDSERPVINWTIFVGIAAGVALIIALYYGIQLLIGPKKYSDSQLFARFNSSVVLLEAGYHYEVSAGGLNLEIFNELPSKFTVGVNDKKETFIQDYSETGPMRYHATGFFISKHGELITNLHVAKPWLFDVKVSEFKNYYKKWLQIKANEYNFSIYNTIGAYVSDIKVEGVLDYIALVPNGNYFDTENAYKCKVITAGEDVNIDLALLRILKPDIPVGCSYVNVDSICGDEEALSIGSHVYTLGFPGGGSTQDIDNSQIHLLSRGGSIIQDYNKYWFGHDAASEHGASGSPVFNEYGQLIGVLNAGYERKQGFNYAVKAKYVKELINESK